MDIKTLTERAKAKDKQALEILYKMYFPKMLGLCIKMTKEDKDSAQDLVHDAFVLAFSSLHHLNNPERFGEWLSTIVRNVILRYLEKKGKMEFISIGHEDENIADDDTSPEAIINRQDILNLVDHLPNGYGKVFRLYAIDGYSHKEIAEILGIEPHSSSSQLSRAKAMLRKMMNQRTLAVVLLLLLFPPLYFYLIREKPSQPDEPKMAEAEDGKNVSGKSRKPVEDKSIRNPPVVSCVCYTKHDTIQIPDTVLVRMFVPDEMLLAQQGPCITEGNDGIIPQPTLPDIGFTTEEVSKNLSRWQMLAAGSLGPALAQNIYRLFSTGPGGDIDDSPTFPENISTWEDYSHYLHRTSHENTPEDTLALIEIADHNQGDIVEREQHDRPVTFGISLSKPLSDRWSFETGLQYSILRSRSTVGSREYHIGKEQKVHYLGIPLGLSYRIAGYKCLSAYGSAGLSLNIPVYGKVDHKYVVDNMSAHSDYWHIKPPVQWSAHFSLGLQYRILPKMTLFAEPTLYWHIPNGSSTHTTWTEHPITFSVPFGIRLTW